MIKGRGLPVLTVKGLPDRMVVVEADFLCPVSTFRPCTDGGSIDVSDELRGRVSFDSDDGTAVNTLWLEDKATDEKPTSSSRETSPKSDVIESLTAEPPFPWKVAAWGEKSESRGTVGAAKDGGLSCRPAIGGGHQWTLVTRCREQAMSSHVLRRSFTSHRSNNSGTGILLNIIVLDRMEFIHDISTLQFSRANPFNPISFTTHGSQILKSSFCDPHNIFNSHTTHRLVLLQNFVINVFGVSDRLQ